MYEDLMNSFKVMAENELANQMAAVICLKTVPTDILTRKSSISVSRSFDEQLILKSSPETVY